MKRIKRSLVLLYFRVKAYICSRFGKNYTPSICRHKTKKFTRHMVFDREKFYSLPDNPEYCGDCLAEMSIRCAWCGREILIGDYITLYVPVELPEKIKGSIVLDNSVPVGCIKCTEFGIVDAMGRWVAPGLVDANIESLFS